MSDALTQFRRRANELGFTVDACSHTADPVGAMQEMFADLVLPQYAERRRGTKSKRSSQLPLHAQLEVRNAEPGKRRYHRKTTDPMGLTIRELIAGLLSQYPELKPKPRVNSENSPENAAYSQYRKWRKDVAKQEAFRDQTTEFQEFMRRLDDRMHDTVLQLIELLHYVTDNETFAEWLALAMSVLPSDVSTELFWIPFSYGCQQVLGGLGLQARAERQRRPYRRPDTN